MLHLILGGARSGKSSFAEKWLAEQAGDQQMIYIATAQAFDNEMRDRILRHQADRRADNWQLLESPLALAEQIHQFKGNSYVLIDCLTLWLNNQLFHVRKSQQPAEISASLSKAVTTLVQALNEQSPLCTIALVSNEVGQGVVPIGEQNRLFVDHNGWLNQQMAAIANKVTLVTAGLPMTLKGDS